MRSRRQLVLGSMLGSGDMRLRRQLGLGSMLVSDVNLIGLTEVGD